MRIALWSDSLITFISVDAFANSVDCADWIGSAGNRKQANTKGRQCRTDKAHQPGDNPTSTHKIRRMLPPTSSFCCKETIPSSGDRQRETKN